MMPRRACWLALSIVVSSLLSLSGTVAFADQFTDRYASPSDAPLPQTGGGWPYYYYAQSPVVGEYSPALQLTPHEFEGVPKNILVEKSLAAQLEGAGTITASELTVSADSCPVNNRKLDKLKSEFENKSLTVADVNKIATDLYDSSLQKGHLCDVSVSQADAAGALAFTLIPVTVRNITIEEGKYFKTRAVKSRISSEEGKPLNINTLEREIRQIENNPDLKLETTLEPVEFSHDVNLKIKIKDEKPPVHLVGFFNNMNLKEYGNYFEGATAVYNNLSGFGDTLAVSGVFSKGGQALFTHYELPVGHFGTKLYGEYSFGHSSPRGQTYSNLDYAGRANVTTFGVVQPLYDRKNTRFAVDANLDIKNFRTKLFKHNVELERLRILRFGFQLDRDDKYGNTSLRDEIGAGLPFWGGSDSRESLLSIARGGSQFFRNTISLTRTQNLPWGAENVFRSYYQTTPNNLPDSDIYAAGGTVAGRGYREGLILGDKALYLSNELSFPCYLIPKNLKVPFSEDKLRDSIKLLAFTDYTWTHLNNADASVNSSYQLLSTGFGVRMTLTRYFTGRLDVGFPLLREYPFKNRPRIHFGIESAIF